MEGRFHFHGDGGAGAGDEVTMHLNKNYNVDGGTCEKAGPHRKTLTK